MFSVIIELQKIQQKVQRVPLYTLTAILLPLYHLALVYLALVYLALVCYTCYGTFDEQKLMYY